MSARKLLLLVIDVVLIVFAAFVTAVVMPSNYGWYELATFEVVALVAGVLILVRMLLKTYNSIWRFADSREYLLLIISDSIACLICMFIVAVSNIEVVYIYVICACMLSLLAALFSRFAYRQIRYYSRNGTHAPIDAKKKRVAIIGAGYAGTTLVEELQNSAHSIYKPICFFDSSRSKIGSFIHGVRVCDYDHMKRILNESDVDEIIIAIPSLTAARRMEMVNACMEAGCKVKIYEYPFVRANSVKVGKQSNKLALRDIDIEDLLPRDSISFDMANVNSLVHNSVVLVTGGGGSIGSELCRQIASMAPKKLIILDIYENSAFEIQQELIAKYGGSLELVTEIASIRDLAKLEKIFARHWPEIVFHAAAHKHVPLMEDSCDEAVKNNVFGTYNLVETSEKFSVRKFIMISTDKAVNPTNVMGATKRMCEMIIQSKRNSSTYFVAVRFGNVLGSNGSVIPMFTKQILAGGPITITDRRITRYFMTIPEAVQLVMQAGAMAARSEIFVLDMGQPVKIVDLAENMIRLAGLTPYKEIDIIEVGLRPGEKLYEELLMQNDKLTRTGIEKIFIDREQPVGGDELRVKLSLLRGAMESDDMDDIRNALKRVVPTYHDPSLINSRVGISSGTLADISYLDDLRSAK